MTMEKNQVPEGDACGWERYCHIGYDSGPAFYRSRSDRNCILRSNERGGLFCPAYQGTIYYCSYSSNYLFASDLDGTNERVIMPLEERPSAMTVNRFGIILLSYESVKMEIRIYTHQGKLQLKTLLEGKGDISCPYVCGTTVYYLQANKDGSQSAYRLHINLEKRTHTVQRLYEGLEHSDDPEKMLYVKHTAEMVLGSEDYALVYVTNSYEKDGDDCLFANSAAWYYYDIKTRKRYCLSNPHYSPDNIRTEPEKYAQYLEDPQNAKDWVQIAHFDIANRLIWVYRSARNKQGEVGTYLVPYNLQPGFLNYPRKDFPAWKENERLNNLRYGRYYFDGRYRCYSESYNVFDTYTRAGEKMHWSGGHGSCDNFEVVGDILFLDSDLSGRASQFELTDGKPILLRDDWRGSTSSRKFDETREELIKNYEAEKLRQKQPAKGPDSGAGAAKPPAQSPGNTFTPNNKLAYWEEFKSYFESNPTAGGIKCSKPADRNWYALRVGSAKFRIECSVNSKNQTLRVGFFLENSQEYYGRAATQRDKFESALNAAVCNNLPKVQFRWDNTVADANVSVLFSYEGLGKDEQFAAMSDVISAGYGMIGRILGL